jgi:hypothetical protein
MATHRVVVLADPGRLLDEKNLPAPAGLNCIHVSTGYEAAAELLVEPSMALVVELSSIAGKHLKLLEVARRCGVDVFGVGALPAELSSDDLSGVRLVSRKDLPELLARSARQGGEPKVRLQPRHTAGQYDTTPTQTDRSHPS